MTTRTVTTQAELDKAIAEKAERIEIRSPEGVWLDLDLRGDSSHVVARGSSHVVAWDSSHVDARGSSHVVAWDSSHVVAWGSSHVDARGSSHVDARGSSHVDAWDSSHVVAWDSSHVVARDSSHVVAGSHVAVHLHSARAEITGGVLIDLTALDKENAETWAGFTGAKTLVPDDGPFVGQGVAVLYKAVRDDLRSARGFGYSIGQVVECDDWVADDRCGHGLHLSPHPAQAREYDGDATRYLECHVLLGELRPLDHAGAAKAKAPRVHVVREVDLWGRPIAASADSVATS